jgi:hypothetical protein
MQDLAMAGLASCCSMTIQTAAATRESLGPLLCFEAENTSRLSRWLFLDRNMAVERMGKIPKGGLKEVHVVAEDTTPGERKCFFLRVEET